MKRITALCLLCLFLALPACSSASPGGRVVPLPPNAEYEEINGIIFCRGVDPDAFAAYRAELRQDGWREIHTYGAYSLSWWYLKGNELLYILDQSFGGGDEIRLTHTPGYRGGERKGALTCEEALPIVQQAIEDYPDDYWPDLSGKEAKYLAERDLPGIFEATGMQLFQAFTDEDYLGTFLLGGKGVRGLLVFFEDSFAGICSESCAVDIDGDGQIELLNLHDGGSGVYRTNVGAYKIIDGAVTLAYRNTWFHSFGLQMKRVSDTEVRLTGREGKDWPLRVEGDKIAVDAEDFPFSELMGGPTG